MARRGGRRGRRSRSRQNSRGAGSRSSKAKSSKSRSRNTRGSGARKSAPSKRRNTRTTSRASNRRATASKARRAAPKRTAPKKKAPTRRTPTKNTRGSGISQSRKNIGTKIGTSVKNTAKKVASTVGRVTRPPSARAKTVTSTRQSAFNKQLKNIQAANKPSFGPVADGATYAKNITNYNMKSGKTPEIRAKAYEQTLSGRKGLFDDATSGSGPVASGDAYARGLQTSRFGSPMNAAKTVLNTIPGVNFRLQNDKELADSVGRAPTLTRRRRGGGGVSRIQQQVAAQQMQPEIAQAPIPDEEYLPQDAGDLTRIQTQAYNTALSNNMAGLGGDFDFGPQGSQMSISQAPGLQAGQSRGSRRIRRFNRGRRRGAGDSFKRGGRRIQEFTSTQLNI